MPPAITSSSPRSTRIRENQRRSRQRKREYLALLESRLSRCRSEGVSASHAVQQAALRVKRENAALKELLRSCGVADHVIEHTIAQHGLGGGADAGGEADGDENRNDRPRDAGCGGTDESYKSPGSEASGTSCCGLNDPEACAPGKARGCAPFGLSIPFTTTERASICSSLSCEDAYRIIKQILQKKSGPADSSKLFEIALELYPGFREADIEGDGCRVKDDVFCDVLERLNVVGGSVTGSTGFARESAIHSPISDPGCMQPVSDARIPTVADRIETYTTGEMVPMDEFGLGVPGMTPLSMAVSSPTGLQTTMAINQMPLGIPPMGYSNLNPQDSNHPYTTHI